MIPSLLWIDAGAGLIGGGLVVLLSAWLSRLYALPMALIVVMGITSVLYGTYSLSLARRRVRPRMLIAILAIANATWAAFCAIAAVVVVPHATYFGIAHLGLESLFVGGLAVLEWRNMESLLIRS